MEATMRIAALRLVYGLLLSLFVIPASAEQGLTAGFYKFRTIPEHVLLLVHPNDWITGYSGSLWYQSIETEIDGYRMQDGYMILRFFDTKISNERLRFLQRECYGKKRSQEKPCGERTGKELYELTDSFFDEHPPFNVGKYAFRENAQHAEDLAPHCGYWSLGSIEHEKSLRDNELRFVGIPSLGLQSSETRLAPASCQARPAKEKESRGYINALEKLFSFAIQGINTGPIAGTGTSITELGASRFHHAQRCKSVAALLEKIIVNAGVWDANVTPEGGAWFTVEIKSHSSREFFFKPGHWWKARLEIEARESASTKNCSEIHSRVVDSVTCPAPPTDDPENQRQDCYERIDFDSQAEARLHEKILGAIKVSFLRSDEGGPPR